MEAKQLLIGGQALRNLGHDRHTDDIDYLVYEEGKPMFTTSEKTDYINAASNDFFKAVWKMEADSTEKASPQALAELKAYAFVQHCQNFNFAKADACEYDLKFLNRKLGVTPLLVQKFVSKGEYSEIIKCIKS